MTGCLKSRAGASLRNMKTLVIDHPLVAHKMSRLRREETSSATFRLLAEELVTLLAYEATENLEVESVSITTPVAATVGQEMKEPRPLVVPILRAGLGMLNGMVRLMPTAEVGFLGLVRDEETLSASIYADRLPDNLHDRQVFVLDPMLATGGTLIAAIDILLDRGAKDVTAICLLAAPEGLARLEESYGNSDANVTIVTAGLDEKLNEKGYIVPGLGDAGDRLYGTV
jgi:uracil phosphoribosyltransferase